MKYLSIDRIEGGFAVCEKEDRGMVQIPLGLLPDGAGEGDVLREEDGGYALDPEETQRRREEAAALLEQLFSDD